MTSTITQRRYRVASAAVIARIARANGITDWPHTTFAASVTFAGVTYFWTAA